MKKLLFLLLLLSISCNKEANTISENTALKDIPETFFVEKSTHKVQTGTEVINYTNEFNRLPNTEFSKFYLKKYPETYLPYFNVTLNLNLDNIITLEGVPILKEELISYVKEFIDFAAEGKQAMIHLNFEENIALKNYIAFITFVKEIETKQVIFNPKVFIYNTKSLPDCDCSL